MPKVAVIMPVYNTEKYVGEAIESILNQTFTDFELIIVDDGSTDTSSAIIQEYAQKDKRIKHITNNINQGLVHTRNKALKEISTDILYIGICDADDIVGSARLQKTVKYLDKYTDISAVGVDLQYIDAAGNKGSVYRYETNADKKQKIALSQSPLSHGGSLIRIADRKKIGLTYDTDFSRAHDYELWTRFIGHGYKLAGIADTDAMTHHRISGGEQGKRKYLKLTLKNSIKLQRRLVFRYKVMPNGKSLLYFLTECLLYILPGSFVFWLFKKVRGA